MKQDASSGQISSLLAWSVLILCQMALPQAIAAATETDTVPLRQVSLQLKWNHQFQFAGYYAAIEQGFYRDAGLDVDLIEYSPSQTPIDQLLGGRVEFAVSDTGALLYRATGAPLVALAAVFQRSPSVLISLEQSGISDLSQLRGRRVMLSGGFMNAELMAMLKTADIDSQNLRAVPSITDVSVLIDGNVDAYNGYTTNEVFTLNQLGIPHTIFHPNDFGVDFYGDILLTTEALISSDPGLVRNFRDASLRGWAFAVENPDQVVDLILEKYNPHGRSRDHLLFEATEAIKLIMPHVVPIGYMNEARWQHISNVFRLQGLLTRPVDIDAFIYREPLDSNEFYSLISRYRTPLALIAVAMLGLMMLFHIVRLRGQVSSRTRELQAAMVMAENEARTDTLTGLSNRRRFFEAMSRDLAQASRSGLPLVLLYLDIDHFKQINDRYGHAAGDEVLRQLGSVFRQHCRSGDIVARIGGEEFALGSLNTSREDVMVVAERLRRAIESKPVRIGNTDIVITVSIGISMMERDDNAVEDLLRKADTALYQAKQAGRNTIRLWKET